MEETSEHVYWVDINLALKEGLKFYQTRSKQYRERVDRLSQQDRLIKFCTDAGFLKTVEVGQYFMTKDTEEFSQFTESVACREYTLPRMKNPLTRKVGSEGTPKLGPHWK